MHYWGFVALALIASTANALQARVNGEASIVVGNPVVAAMMSVGGGFVIATMFVLLRRKTRRLAWQLLSRQNFDGIRGWHLFAGVGGGVFILGQAMVVPLFGVSLYMIAIVAGQTGASLAVDHLGIGPAGKKAITTWRILSVFLAISGVAVSALGSGETLSIALSAVLYGLAAGGATAVQYALNGRIAQSVGSALVTSSLNFMMGFLFLTLVLIAATTFGVVGLEAPPSLLEHWQLWLGGPLGLLFIASATLFVRRLGVLAFAVVSVLGQLIGAFGLDVFFPADGASVTPLLGIGLGITALGVVLSGRAREGNGR